MKVSIIIPVYHVEKYIERCVMSVLKQDYRPLEVVFVDDFSDDRSMDIAKRTISEYGESQIEFQYIKHSENQGQGAARNTGIRASKGDYLYFLDSDDELKENSISVLVNQHKKYPQSEMVHGRMVLVDGTDYHHISVYREMEYIEGNNNIRKYHYSLNGSFPDSACDILVKKKFVVDNNLFFKKGILFEDTHWLGRAVKKLQFVSFVNVPTYIRFVNPNSTMTSLTIEKEVKNCGIILKDFLSSLDEPYYNEQLFTYFRKFLIYYDASNGGYGYNELYTIFKKEFFQRHFYKLWMFLLMYRIKWPLLSEEKIKSRLRGYMYAEINKFWNQR